ncbi:hypothetical protein [Sphingomonas crocodyli]|uniref:Uncharacterized protein n=1 Tax=Sphingomonas crocodyli TaxID=1979270 RepID=A0A437M546_9SPHN|nr:hypothetical protein [Sphingomonas crocodyli]RVT92693.1 hypothetical protein EOD43_01865 [Sphingomonas crocodyli]
MAKTLFGGLVGGFALYMIGFLFWGTPLSLLAFNRIEEPQAAALQLALAQTLTPGGTGTYTIPSPGSANGSVLYGKGPIATIHYNMSGFPVVDTGALLQGLILALITGVLIALAMGAVGNRVIDFASRARIAILFALGTTLYTVLGQPIFNHFGWGYWVYLFVGQFLGLAVCGLIIARWFLPRTALG